MALWGGESRSLGHENRKKKLDFQITSLFLDHLRIRARTAKSGPKTATDDECPNGEGTSTISIISVLTFNPDGPEIGRAHCCVRGNPRRSFHVLRYRYIRAQIISQNYANRSLFSSTYSRIFFSRFYTSLHPLLSNPNSRAKSSRIFRKTRIEFFFLFNFAVR